jgi:hypothetical protein
MRHLGHRLPLLQFQCQSQIFLSKLTGIQHVGQLSVIGRKQTLQFCWVYWFQHLYICVIVPYKVRKPEAHLEFFFEYVWHWLERGDDLIVYISHGPQPQDAWPPSNSSPWLSTYLRYRVLQVLHFRDPACISQQNVFLRLSPETPSTVFLFDSCLLPNSSPLWGWKIQDTEIWPGTW